VSAVAAPPQRRQQFFAVGHQNPACTARQQCGGFYGIGQELTFRKYSKKAVIGTDAAVVSLSKIINAVAEIVFHCKTISRLWQPLALERSTPFSRKNIGPHTAQ
jgi:hypothetical protein